VPPPAAKKPVAEEFSEAGTPPEVETTAGLGGSPELGVTEAFAKAANLSRSVAIAVCTI